MDITREITDYLVLVECSLVQDDTLSHPLSEVLASFKALNGFVIICLHRTDAFMGVIRVIVLIEESVIFHI